MFRKLLAGSLAAAVCFSCVACTGDKGSDTDSKKTVEIETVDPDDLFTDRDREEGYEGCVTVTLSNSGSRANGAGVHIEENTVTITAAGTYLLTGTLTEGQIRVQVTKEQKVQLVLQNAAVSCTGGAALYVIQGDKVFVTLAEGTENTLVSAGEFTQDAADGVDAAVYSKADLTFNGSGALEVRSEAGHGIVSKDDLKFTAGTYTVNAAKQGITGKDCLCIEDGSFTVESGTDGLHSKNDEDASLGYVYILAGSFQITAGNDGIDASKDIYIADGDFTIFTGEGSASVTHSNSSWGGGWGGSSSTASEESCKGLKAGEVIAIIGGSFDIDAEDDAIHSNDSVAVTGGTLAIASGDDAFHAEGVLDISGGTINITKSYEGLEGTYIAVSGGDITVTASDDGMNAAGGNDGSGMAGPWGHGGGFGEATDAYILISGGTLVIDAGGDGVDSNGDLTVTGGTTYVNGPTNSGNGPLDYAGNGKITGGVFIAVGSAGMAMNFGTSSTQGAILCSLNGTAPGGTEVAIQDSDGKTLAGFTATKNFQSILISAPGMVKGGTYTVFVGQASGEFTLDSIVNGGSSGGGPGGGGRPGR